MWASRLLPSRLRQLAQQSAASRQTACSRCCISSTRLLAYNVVEPGVDVATVPTPALLVDLNALERNVRSWRNDMSDHPAVKVRPHVKAHKCPAIAHLQLQLLQAEGICCQKVSEAVAMANAGIRDIFLSNEVVAEEKITQFVSLQNTGARLSVCVDEAGPLRALSSAAAKQHELMGGNIEPVGVLVDVNVGQDRCGVDTAEDAMKLAELANSLPGVAFKGIQAYHGGIQLTRDTDARRAAARQVAERAAGFVEALEAAGLPCEVVTGGGTGTCHFDAASGVFNEVQPGSFIFGDVQYARLQREGGRPLMEQSLWVLATVMSRSEARRMVVLDAGLKAVSLESTMPAVMESETGGHPTEYKNGGDEHGILLWPYGVHMMDAQLPGIGSKLKLQPGHCDPTVNMYDEIVAYRGDTVVAVWPIAARGPGL